MKGCGAKDCHTCCVDFADSKVRPLTHGPDDAHGPILLCLMNFPHRVQALILQAVQKLADECASKGVDVLINNAGIFGAHHGEELGPLKGRQANGRAVGRCRAAVLLLPGAVGGTTLLLVRCYRRCHYWPPPAAAHAVQQHLTGTGHGASAI